MDQSPTLSADTAAAWGVTSYDPWDPRLTSDNVWGMYRAMRQAGPALRSDAHGGFWSITRYDDIRAAAADPAVFSSAQGTVVGRKKRVPSIPLEFDRPQHTAYRKAMQAPFLRSRVDRFRDLIRSEVAELLDRVADARRFDIVQDIAAPLPLTIISEFLGIVGERQVLHQQLGHDFVYADIATVGAAEATYAFMQEEVQARRTQPGSDFISELVQMDVDGRRFEEQEIVRMARSLALALALALAPHHHQWPLVDAAAHGRPRRAEPLPRAADNCAAGR